MHAIINQSVEYNLRVENTPKHDKKKKKKPERIAICYFTAISAADDARNGCLLATLICHSCTLWPCTNASGYAPWQLIKCFIGAHCTLNGSAVSQQQESGQCPAGRVSDRQGP